jgi:hypothetical protein
MKAMRFAILAAAALIVAACLPVTTKNPVGTTAGFKQDPALIGVWKAEPDKNNKDDKPGYLAFLNAEESSAMTAVMIAPGKDAGDWSTYKLKLATLGTNHFINAWGVLNNGRPADEAEAKADIPLLYRFGKDGKLTLYLLDEDATRAAIKTGKIKGEIEPGDTGDVHIIAEPKALDTFFASKEGAALFVKPLIVLDRVK